MLHLTLFLPCRKPRRPRACLAMLLMLGSVALVHSAAADVPNVEPATLTFAPEVPPAITRRTPATIVAKLDSQIVEATLTAGVKYRFWTFNGRVPGPFIRARVGDTLELHVTNSDTSGMPHNVDLHCVTGPGGGAPVTTAMQGDLKIVQFKLMHPGLFVYHCAAPPVMDHIANGMYGLALVEPENGLPPVDREFYILQSEFYTKPLSEDYGVDGDELTEYSHEAGLAENPTFVVFNGRSGALMASGALKARVGETVRLYVGNAGPNKVSSFHVIGEIFDRVYREGDLVSEPGRSIQTTLIPAGGAAVVDFKLDVPGTYTLVDHAIFRIEKGAVGFLEVEGAPMTGVYHSMQAAVQCPGCLVHP